MPYDVTTIEKFRDALGRVVQYNRDTLISSSQRDWVNEKLARWGVTPMISQEWRFRASLTGTVQRTEAGRTLAMALDSFQSNMRNNEQFASINLEAGSFVKDTVKFDLDNVQVNHNGEYIPVSEYPTPSAETVELTLDELKDEVRAAIIEGYRKFRWCWEEVVTALDKLGLDPLPPEHKYTVSVPVAGTMKRTVTAFNDDEAKEIAAQNINADFTATGEPTIVRANEV